MKVIALLAALVVSTQAFAPAASIFSRIAEMDLFAPKKDQNNYGARNQKNLAVGKITEKSYIPAGLTKAQYEKARAADEEKKKARYAKNVAKAGKFQDYTAFYIKRGTDITDAWAKTATRGHDMAKTKYDWSGQTNQAILWAKEAKKPAKK
jgi:hypothetical protein